MGTFGDTLRQAREDLGASLDDAERETHVHRRYLEALEREEPNALPAAVYTRGFIRTYSQYLGLNPDSMLDLFGHQRGSAESPQVRPIPAQVNAPRPISMRPVVALGGLVLVGLLATYLWTQYNSFLESIGQVEQMPTSRTAPGAASPTPVGRPAAPILSSSPSPEAVPAPSPPVISVAPSPVASPSRGLVVQAQVVERTWLEVVVDGQPALAETVQPGFSRSFTAEQQVRMRVGNAAGVQVAVNGVTQGPLGARGQAVDANWGRQ